MLIDAQYEATRSAPSHQEHRYGPSVHLLNDPFLSSLLARASVPECKYPELPQVIGTLYRHLVAAAIAAEFPTESAPVRTRMAGLHPEGTFQARILARNTPAVCVSLARAGMIPSQVCFETLTQLFDPDRVRQDHIAIQRTVDSHEHVTGALMAGAKIGGPIDDAIVVIADPMGATGSTIASTMAMYRQRGKPRKVLALHLIITPEYLAAVTKNFPEVSVWALRLDRGLSPQAVLSTVPGTCWAEEKGLNEKQYIVPGAGGLGEVLNNAFV